MQRRQPRGAERPVLLLRMLQDQERDLVFSIGVMLSQMHSGSGLPQSAHSGTSSASVLALASDCFDIRPLYASPANPFNNSGQSVDYSAGAWIAAGSAQRRRNRSIRR